MKNNIKCLLLSDHVNKTSGIANVSRNIIKYSSNSIEWVQLGGAVSDKINNDSELVMVGNKNVKIYPCNDYGNQFLLKSIIEKESPDIILHFTDPRFWIWLYEMEWEIRNIYKIPIAYYSVWDNEPTPYWNKPFYDSCDGLIAISKLTDVMHKTLTKDPDKCYYTPHGVDTNVFFPILGPDKIELDEIRQEFHEKHNCKFIIFWNNINMKRKNGLMLLEAFAKFYRMGNNDVCLVMHTDPFDSAGYNLLEIKRELYPEVNVIFSPNKLLEEQINIYYNISDAVINISSNEGFGLSTLEAQFAGTHVIAIETGGLKDQLKTSNSTSLPVKVRVPNGSVSAPIIYNDYTDLESIVQALRKVKKMKSFSTNPRKAIKQLILRGMTATQMGLNISNNLYDIIGKFNPDRFKIETL